MTTPSTIISNLDGTSLILMFKCPFCGKMSEIGVNKQEFNGLRAGGLVQNVLAGHSAEDREIVITGTCKDCQSSVFCEDEDEEDCEEDLAM